MTRSSSLAAAFGLAIVASVTVARMPWGEPAVASTPAPMAVSTWADPPARMPAPTASVSVVPVTPPILQVANLDAPVVSAPPVSHPARKIRQARIKSHTRVASRNRKPVPVVIASADTMQQAVAPAPERTGGPLGDIFRGLGLSD